MSGTRAGSVSVQQFIVRTAAAPLPSLSGSSAQHCTVGCLVASGYGCSATVATSLSVALQSAAYPPRTHSPYIYTHQHQHIYYTHQYEHYLHSPIPISTVHSTTLNLPKHVKCKERLIQNLMPPKVNSQQQLRRESMIHLHNSAWLKFCFYD